MAIDINQPVQEGHDVVLNINGDQFEQRLGTPEEFNKLAEEGRIVGVHLDPHRDVVEARNQAKAAQAAKPTKETSKKPE